MTQHTWRYLIGDYPPRENLKTDTNPHSWP